MRSATHCPLVVLRSHSERALTYRDTAGVVETSLRYTVRDVDSAAQNPPVSGHVPLDNNRKLRESRSMPTTVEPVQGSNRCSSTRATMAARELTFNLAKIRRRYDDTVNELMSSTAAIVLFG